MAEDIRFMKEALKEASKALHKDEVPVGAVVVCDNKIVARAHNIKEKTTDPTAHAEIIALKKAAKSLSRWRLSDCTIYVTKEPCIMCSGALINARVKRLVYGCPDIKAGGAESLYAITSDSRLNHRIEVTSGLLRDESAHMITGFFQSKRSEKSSKA